MEPKIARRTEAENTMVLARGQGQGNGGLLLHVNKVSVMPDEE